MVALARTKNDRQPWILIVNGLRSRMCDARRGETLIPLSQVPHMWYEDAVRRSSTAGARGH
jgi:hypothetical protein